MMFKYPRTITRFGVLGGLMSAMSSVPVGSQTLPGPAKSIFGVYGRSTIGHDSIQVIEKADHRIGVRLKLYYANGHTCQLNQDGKWSEDHVAIVAEGLDANTPCKLNLFFQNNGILLKDEALQCAPVYCGTRGKLDNVSLSKVSPNRK